MIYDASMKAADTNSSEHGLIRRLIEVELILLFVQAPTLIGFAVLHLSGSHLYILWAKFVTVAACVAVLVNSQVFDFIQSRFPALQRIVIRLILCACLLLMYGSGAITSIDGAAIAAGMASIIIAALFVFIAHFYALLSP